MNQTNTARETFFSDDAEQMFFSILKKYNLDETDDQVFSKLEVNQPFFGEIVMNITRNFFEGSIKKGDLSSLLKEKLNISMETSEALAKDIEEQIIPLVQKIEAPSEEEEEKGEEEFITKEEQELEKEPDIFPQAKPTEVIEKPKLEPPPTTQTEQPKKPDTYRESIE